MMRLWRQKMLGATAASEGPRLGIAAVWPEGVRSVDGDAPGVNFTSLIDLVHARENGGRPH